MLDKSLPFKEILMSLNTGLQETITTPVLPHGYTLRQYRPGDENHWARIETAAEEFDSEEKALTCFAGEYGPHAPLLCERMVFACDKDNMPVATSSIWFEKNDATIPMLHWVATSPEHQRRGLGKALVQQCILLSRELHPDKTMYLHTQTWSHVAVRLYFNLGFRMVRASPFTSRKSDYTDALDVLAAVYEPAFIEQLKQTSKPS